jgi:hypothetical protein
MFGIGGVLLAIASVRGIIYLLPDGPNWSALGYILGVVAIAVVIAVMVKVAEREWGLPQSIKVDEPLSPEEV